VSLKQAGLLASGSFSGAFPQALCLQWHDADESLIEIVQKVLKTDLIEHTMIGQLRPLKLPVTVAGPQRICTALPF